jgi:hypothetical protein
MLLKTMNKIKIVEFFQSRKILKKFILAILVAIVPIFIAMSFMNLWQWDLSIPLVYYEKNGDETWQLILTKMLVDTGWILYNPYLGAPDVAHWHNNAAAQTSALHSVLMLGLSKLIHDPVKVQQIYFLLNFSLISLTSYFSCRLLGLSRLAAFCIGIMFSLLGYRFNFIIYSFLSNYFTVPLALVAIFWIMTGEFSKFFSDNSKAMHIALKESLSSSKFLLGLFFIVLIAISDGYYAFFTLLLLGFSIFARIVAGDIKKPVSLFIPVIYTTTLIIVALLVAWPISSYKNSHPEEFAPGGVKDVTLIKHPFEAEVYSSSLKLLLTPPSNHRIEIFGSVGNKIIQTSYDARLHKMGGTSISLGIIGSIIFLAALTVLIKNLIKNTSSNENLIYAYTCENRILRAAILLILFIFLCSITGGIGSLVALVFPDIRAYDRYPLFLLFVLYIFAGTWVTMKLKQAHGNRWWIWVSIFSLITIFSLFDQVPQDSNKGKVEVEIRYLAEKKFVKTIEERLPSGAMVYQYPYSQWLSDSDYYGWGSFAHVRLYLHSAALRWSNGASKNSPVDDWHLRLSRMPINQLITEVRAAGFNAVVLDRSVVSPIEYQRIRNALIQYTSVAPIEDEASKLSFFKFTDLGYSVIYDKSYNNIEKLVVIDRDKLLTTTLSRLINPLEFKKLVDLNNDKKSLIIERSTHPDVFFTAAKLNQGHGDKPIFSLTELPNMQGNISCKLASSNSSVAAQSDTLVMTILNNTDFYWKFDNGKFPLRIGAHLRSLDGTMLRWDDGWRLATGMPGYVTGKATRNEALLLPPNESKEIRFPLSQINLKGFEGSHENLVADFRLLQEGHAWFEHLGCKIKIKS